MSTTALTPIAACLALTRAIDAGTELDDIYGAALDALESGLGVRRAAILLFDPDGVMRFKAVRGLSEGYCRAVEGHTPWQPDAVDPEPIVVPDVTEDASLAGLRQVFASEAIAALTFIPLVSSGRVIGKFMLYYDQPTLPSAALLELAGVFAAQVAFAVARTRAEQQARLNEERLRFALDAASMGTWDWDLASNSVVWSENLERIHGLPPGTFDGTFDSYAREIHPDDRQRVFASVQRALEEGAPHEVEYRLVAPDGTVRWCEGKGRVEHEHGRPVRMSGVCMMITRRKEAEFARLAAAEESSRLKDEFLATLSHELRTPLNAVLGWVQMLQSGELTPARMQQAIDVIGRNARLQAQLIEDILDVSRIITGKLTIEQAPVPLAELIETVIAGASPAAHARRIVVTQSIAPDLPAVQGDARRLYQMLNNILANAVKFTPEGGGIHLDASVDAGMVIISIRDSGAGIAPEFLPFVFDRFRQADSRSTRSHGGLGLGLAIARHVVELHGGEIRAHSDGPGHGTTVTVRLPGTEVPAHAASRPSAPVVAALRLDGTRILVVDDQRDSREMVAALLEHRGATVVPCDSAETALMVLGTERVHLMIIDIAMPQVDGYELIHRLRRAGNETPAVALTAFARLEDERRALASGFAAYCAKPVDGARLARTVRELIPASL